MTHLQRSYQEGFINRSSFPPLQNYQQECFYDDGKEKLNPRCFPISLPIFPHRKRDGDIPIALGFETIAHERFTPEQLQDKKKKKHNDSVSISPTEQTAPGADISPIVLEELVLLGTYTPSSQTNVPACFQKWSINKKDFNGNLQQNLAYNPGNFKTYTAKHEKPELWQKIGCTWDKLQERKVVEKIELNTTEKAYNTPKRLLRRPRLGEQEKADTRHHPNISSGKTFSSKVPGYSGYQPRLPIPSEKQQARTTSNVAYRRYPAISYCLPKYGHNSLMSRTVTLTEPCNPFNKIDIQRICMP